MGVTKEWKNKYNKKYYDKNKDRVFICEICGGRYSLFSKSKHMNRNIHKLMLGFKNVLKNI